MSDDEAVVLAKWGSWDALDAHLDRLVTELLPIVCGHNAPVPAVQVKPTWLARGLLGGQHSGADYEPAEEQRPAVIGLFPAVLTDEALLRVVVTHELVHHWEHLGAHGTDEPSSPDAAAAIIAAHFTDTQRERRWRAGHSSHFIAKASSVAATLGVQLRQLLFS
jgi:hypothetical protein